MVATIPSALPVLLSLLEKVAGVLIDHVHQGGSLKPRPVGVRLEVGISSANHLPRRRAYVSRPCSLGVSAAWRREVGRERVGGVQPVPARCRPAPTRLCEVVRRWVIRDRLGGSSSSLSECQHAIAGSRRMPVGTQNGRPARPEVPRMCLPT